MDQVTHYALLGAAAFAPLIALAALITLDEVAGYFKARARLLKAQAAHQERETASMFGG